MTEQLERTVAFHVDSEVGTLRKVIVNLPGLAHARLTPTNAEELLFDDVIWVTRAKEEHDAFCGVMRDRGVEVLHAPSSSSTFSRYWRRASGCSIACLTSATSASTWREWVRSGAEQLQPRNWWIF